MTEFNTYIAVDWSGGNDRGASPKKDAIWIGVAGEDPRYFRNRGLAEAWLNTRISRDRDADKRVLAGFDFAFAYPDGFASHLTGGPDPFAVWNWFETHVEDAPDSNNRFDLAAQINAGLPGVGPFWGNALKRDIDHLPRKGLDRLDMPFPEKRAIERRTKGTFSTWQLSGAGAVGSQVIMGLPMLSRLRKAFAAECAVWPFETALAPLTLLEIWPSLWAGEIAKTTKPDDIKDARQVLFVAEKMREMDQNGTLAGALFNREDLTAEGWIFGVDPPPTAENSESAGKLTNDCFALPQGVHWTPVDDALAHLRSSLRCVVGSQTVPLAQACGRVLSDAAIANRANPQAPNSAVDGYGFSASCLSAGAMTLPLIEGRAAAGQAFQGVVPEGSAIRILTGAVLPDGVDTVVLEEDCEVTETEIRFSAGLKPFSNARKAGEDINAGDLALPAGQVLRPQDIALAAAIGLPELQVREKLRVGVLSTGDELTEPEHNVPPSKTFDANRPMLLNIAEKWEYAAVDLGHSADDRETLKQKLDAAAKGCDVILTSGGASAGDEDHVSALLKDAGALNHWRIALKPGRPLALGLWNGVPVFGLPGNPVAAFVCAMIFARPALQVLAGANWTAPTGFTVPAAFNKRKKPGRREYLRARLNDQGHVEVFASEGSGRISGLSWAEGLVELPDGELQINPGDPVRYIPFGSFGL